MDDTDSNRKNIKSYFEKLVAESYWESIGELFVGGVGPVGAIVGNPKLMDARNIGASIKIHNDISKKLFYHHALQLFFLFSPFVD
jgi:hypothetical protein